MLMFVFDSFSNGYCINNFQKGLHQLFGAIVKLVLLFGIIMFQGLISVKIKDYTIITVLVGDPG